MSPEQIALVTQWHQAKATLKHWEEYELALRKQVVSTLFGEYGDGSRNADLGNGYTLRNINTTRYDVKDCPEMRQLVAKFCAFPYTAQAGAALLKDKPRMSVTAYRELPLWGRAYMDKFVTTTPQLPQLSIIEPKA